MTADFCTYFDSGYLPRALALHDSLRRHATGSRLFAVCMDDDSHRLLEQLALPDLVPIRRSDFEHGDDALIATSKSRSIVEYYFTCTPSITLFVLKAHPDIQTLFYIDADMYFMSDIGEMLTDMGDASVYIVEHRFPPELSSYQIYGRFNVGVLGFRNDAAALHCLTHWREQCLEWCYDRVEDSRFGDQKYLDEWPTVMQGVRIGTHCGVNVAPWNRMSYRLSAHRQEVLVNGSRLLCYHFQGLRFYSNGIIEPLANDYGYSLDDSWFRLVYKPYVKLVAAKARETGITSTAKRFGKQPDTLRLRQSRKTGQFVLKIGSLLFSLSGWKMDLFLSWMRLQDYRKSIRRRFLQRFARFQPSK